MHKKLIWLPALMLASLVGAPARADAPLQSNGISFNGVNFNGINFNGVNFNGPLLQGLRLNGLRMNGPILQGRAFNGPLIQGFWLNGFRMNGPMFEVQYASAPASFRYADVRVKHTGRCGHASRRLQRRPQPGGHHRGRRGVECGSH